MLFEQFNEKADVYSFGIILWELLTRDVPFSHHNNYEKFKRAVCQNHERPPIPDDCVTNLKDLIERCWDRNPDLRPSFSDIILDIKEILVDVAIGDPIARRFWKKYYLHEEEDISYNDFEENLFEFLNIPDPSDMNEEELNIFHLNKKCLFNFIPHHSKSKTDTGPKVNIEHFGKLLNWFGPVDDPDVGNWRFSILDRFRDALTLEAFFGEITTNEAVDELSVSSNGTYLIRFSESVKGYFSLSQVSQNRRVVHTRIKHIPGGPYIIDKAEFNSLKDLVEQRYSQYKGATSKFYKKIFHQDDEVTAYLNTD